MMRGDPRPPPGPPYHPTPPSGPPPKAAKDGEQQRESAHAPAAFWTRIISVSVDDLSATLSSPIEEDLRESKDMKPAAPKRREPAWKLYFMPR